MPEETPERKIESLSLVLLLTAAAGLVLLLMVFKTSATPASLVAFFAMYVVGVVAVSQVSRIVRMKLTKGGLEVALHEVRRLETKVDDTAKRVEDLRTELIEKLRTDYDRDLRQLRIPAYRAAWNVTRGLPLYFATPNFTYKDLERMGKELTDWYFNDGFLMTPESRACYFALQDVIQSILRSRPEDQWTQPLPGKPASLTLTESNENDRALLASLIAAETDADRRCPLELMSKAKGHEDAPWPALAKAIMQSADIRGWVTTAAEQHYFVARLFASRFRTQLTGDVGSRERSLVSPALPSAADVAGKNE